ncbi:MAG: hypothetical protein ACE5F1_01390 [Planctomycetota bacterium]
MRERPLTWKALFPDERVPPPVKYVRDRDLWLWELPDSKAVSAYVMSTPYEIPAWDELAKLDEATLRERGKIARRVVDSFVQHVGMRQAIEQYCTGSCGHD